MVLTSQFLFPNVSFNLLMPPQHFVILCSTLHAIHAMFFTCKNNFLKLTKAFFIFMHLLQTPFNPCNAMFFTFKNNFLNFPKAFSTFCKLFCEHDFIDLCDVRDLPVVGDLNTKFPIGRFWRFQVRSFKTRKIQVHQDFSFFLPILTAMVLLQVLADPTVEVFGSRDVDR